MPYGRPEPDAPHGGPYLALYPLHLNDRGGSVSLVLAGASISMCLSLALGTLSWFAYRRSKAVLVCALITRMMDSLWGLTLWYSYRTGNVWQHLLYLRATPSSASQLRLSLSSIAFNQVVSTLHTAVQGRILLTTIKAPLTLDLGLVNYELPMLWRDMSMHLRNNVRARMLRSGLGYCWCYAMWGWRGWCGWIGGVEGC